MVKNFHEDYINSKKNADENRPNAKELYTSTKNEYLK